MHKLGFSVVKDVVVAKKTVAAKIVSDLVALFNKWLLIEVVTHANSSTYDEVHFQDFVFLVVDHVLVLSFIKVTRLQSICYIV